MILVRPQSLVLRSDAGGGASRRTLQLALATPPFGPSFETRCFASLLRMRTVGASAGQILS
jgi:hypothetical protein